MFDAMRGSALFQLMIRDLKLRYSGTVLGLCWAILQPVLMMMVLYGVFHYGLQANNTSLFVPWLFVGMISWNFFSESLNSMTGSFQEYSFLVKKIRFPLFLIPSVKLGTAYLTHLIFFFILTIIFYIYGIKPAWAWCQLFLVLPLFGFFVLGIGLISSSFNVFARDFNQVVSVLLQFGLWATPVVWSPDRLPERYRWYLEFHPIYPFIRSYRDILIGGGWLSYHEVLVLLGLSVGSFVSGLWTHRRLRPFFADVL